MMRYGTVYGGVQIDVNPSTYKVEAQITNGNFSIPILLDCNRGTDGDQLSFVS